MLEEYKQILKAQGLSGKDIAGLLDLGYDSYRSLTKSSASSVPKWVRAAIIFYKLGKDFRESKELEVIDPEVVK